MGRLLPVFVAVLAPLGVAAEAAGKVALKQARICGTSECTTEGAERPGDLPFELFGPTIESGRQVGAPAGPGSGYDVALTTQPVMGSRVISLSYFPESGYIHVRGRPGSEAGGALLNTGWVRLTAPERRAYDLLAAGLTPKVTGADAGGDDGGSGVGGVVPTVVGVLAVAAFGVGLLLRRRAVTATPARP